MYWATLISEGFLTNKVQKVSVSTNKDKVLRTKEALTKVLSIFSTVVNSISNSSSNSGSSLHRTSLAGRT